MKTFRYWVRHECQLIIDGTGTKVVFIGGSDVSEQDAKHTALKKAEAVQRKINGDKKQFEEYEVEIREEQIERINTSAVITRNRYGAHVLNVENQMILDVDDPPRSSLFDLFQKKTEDWKLDRLAGAVEKLSRKLNDSLIGFRIYKTCKGFRVIVTGREMLPGDRMARLISKSLNVDELYWFLCKRQNCYRARLTPKPHRIKYKAIRIRLADSLDRREEILSWEKGYLEKSRNYSVCKYIKTVGNDMRNSLISLHDHYTGALTNKKLA